MIKYGPEATLILHFYQQLTFVQNFSKIGFLKTCGFNQNHKRVLGSASDEARLWNSADIAIALTRNLCIKILSKIGSTEVDQKSIARFFENI